MNSTTVSMLHRRELTEGWTLRLLEAGAGAPPDLPAEAFPARVPGVVHADLRRAGLLEDPDVGLREREQHWIGRSRWSYSTRFEHDVVEGGAGEARRADLVFEGLDTIAEIRLNDEVLGMTKNMHRRHRLDVTERLRQGSNELEVIFHPVREEIDRVRSQVGILPATEAEHYPYVRKMASNFGWDWGPVYVTAGPWRPVALETWSGARLAQVRVLPDARPDDAGGLLPVLDVHVDVETSADDHGGRAEIEVSVGGLSGRAAVRGGMAHVHLEVPGASLWWPVGYGEQPLHDVEVTLHVDGEVRDSAQRRVGFRHVTIAEEPDDEGPAWAFVVNGVRVPIRGFNWITDRPFPSEIDGDRLRRRIDQALAANANLLRVWGGGIHESAEFYEYCDATGVLVWQDFLFACAAYPETPEFADEITAEAAQAITDRSHHPSLVLWNANNECTWGYHDWGWREALDGRPWGALYYGEILPRLVAELDPTRPYLPGSPSSGDLETAPNDDSRGVSHIWDVWNQLDYVRYRDRRPAFVAEFGFCGPPAWSTLRRVVTSGDLDPSNEEVRHHLRAEDGVTKLDRGLHAHFPPVSSPEDWFWLAQVNQARAMTLGIDHLRALRRCSGAILWQLNDCWPVISWAVVDGDERLKPVWYAVRDAFAPRRLTVQPGDGGLRLVAVNDDTQDWTVAARVRRVSFEGQVLAEARVPLSVGSGDVAALELPADLAEPGDAAAELLVVDATEARRATWFWERDLDLAYPRARWEAAAEPGEDGLHVTVTARTLVRDLTLHADRLTTSGAPGGIPADADGTAPPVASDSMLTLLPGESTTIVVRGAGPEHDEAVLGRSVLRAVNDVEEMVRRG